MARPIEATPVLRGEDAAAFVKAAQNPRPFPPPAVDVEKMRAEIQKVMERRAKK